MDFLDYLAHKRRMIAIDEWGWYAAMAGLYFTEEYALLGGVFVFGAIANSIAYKSYWELERKILKDKFNIEIKGTLEKLINRFSNHA
ncbi:hypothetical protein HYX16_03580 [Candidatus Woesearchaeota archaeon]|nr:hypothetical protein [Candidatus Woesearchaeota archaeon]